jgi:N-acetylmuramoyl-L-alanine amidase
MIQSMPPKLIVILLTLLVPLIVFNSFTAKPEVSGAPPYGIPQEEVPDLNPFSYLKNWQRPDGPAKVGIQVGHWKNNEVPEELKNLRGNTGATGGGKWEWEVNHAIVQEIAKILEAQNVQVDIIPATVPPDYWADVFIAVHADGSEDTSKSGFKFAAPWRDFTGNADELVAIIEAKYADQTEMIKDDNVSRNMRGYYAFAWWRFDHSIHPMTTAIIAETGFLTNRKDQQFLINTPELSAQPIAEGILEYLSQKSLL